MDLRDLFAARFAAALVDAHADAGQVAKEAYDLAEAMLMERARRIDAEEARAIAHSSEEAALPPVLRPLTPASGRALLDEPAPMIEPDPGYEDDLDPALLEPPYDPTWDLEARWKPDFVYESSAPGAPPPSPSPPGPEAGLDRPRPGLVRTQPEAAEDKARKERSA